MEEKISLGSSLPQCLANNAEGSPRRLTLPFFPLPSALPSGKANLPPCDHKL